MLLCAVVKEERILTGPSSKDPLPPADQAGIWRFQRKAGLPVWLL